MNNDNFVDLSFEESDEEETAAFGGGGRHQLVMFGQPKPKPSPRFCAKFAGLNQLTGKAKIQRWTVNPATDSMKEFKQSAKDQLTMQSTQVVHFPVFHQEEPVGVKVWFCRRPPNTCFEGGNRSRPGAKLQESFRTGVPYCLSICPDTDNCLKFVLDTLKGVAWKDDNQVGRVIAYKCHDIIPPYEGRTVIEFEVCRGPALRFRQVQPS